MKSLILGQFPCMFAAYVTFNFREKQEYYQHLVVRFHKEVFNSRLKCRLLVQSKCTSKCNVM